MKKDNKIVISKTTIKGIKKVAREIVPVGSMRQKTVPVRKRKILDDVLVKEAKRDIRRIK